MDTEWLLLRAYATSLHHPTNHPATHTHTMDVAIQRVTEKKGGRGRMQAQSAGADEDMPPMSWCCSPPIIIKKKNKNNAPELACVDAPLLHHLENLGGIPIQLREVACTHHHEAIIIIPRQHDLLHNDIIIQTLPLCRHGCGDWDYLVVSSSSFPHTRVPSLERKYTGLRT
jgi:hypothetical protein